jgi:hypothetical protein
MVMKNFILILTVLINTQAIGQVVFTDVTEDVGIDYFGRSYGAAWNDYDGDGWLEFYTSCHYHIVEPFFTNDFPRLWKNFQGQSFSDTFFTLDAGGQADMHGAVMYDFDNDGDKDILQLTGGTKSNVFYINNNTTDLVDNAVDLNIDLPLGRGRQSTCIDIANDGITDIVINNEIPREPGQPTSSVFVRQFGQAYNLAFDNGFNEEYSSTSYISDINGNGKMDLVVMKFDSIVFYSIDDEGFFQFENYIEGSNLRDLAIADFTGDLLPDIFTARGRKTNNDIQQFSDNAIHAMFRMNPNSQVAGCTFELSGSASLRVIPANPVAYTLHFGSSLILPDETGIYVGEISMDNPDLDGWQEPNPADGGIHVYIGRPDGVELRAEVRSFTSGQVIGLEIVAEDEILNFNAFGNSSTQDASIRDALLVNQGNYNFEIANPGQGQLFHNSLNVTFGDYENDGDLDLYVLCSGHAVNQSDYIYENLGNGNLLMHEQGWGINGQAPGVGDAVTTADYNNDGFLDILVLNGSLTNFLDSAKMQLYRNEGNDNNWIKIIPKGMLSTADGFGAKAYVTANGTTQLREMTGAIHTSSQDDPRLHFGIGQATMVDSIIVYWPSGLVDAFYWIEPNQIMEITEGSSPLNTSKTDIASFKIYPNPSLGGLLNLEDPDQKVYRARFFDTNGRLINSLSGSDMREKAQHLNLPKGLYMIEFEGINNKPLKSQKWIIY